MEDSGASSPLTEHVYRTSIRSGILVWIEARGVGFFIRPVLNPLYAGGLAELPPRGAGRLSRHQVSYKRSFSKQMCD